MMSYINETDFVIENKELVYPEIITDGLQLYYDAKGKRDTDYHRDTMLDMSGNKNHGKLHNFAYEKHSGYKDGLVFDYIDDKLVRPALNLKPNDFTFMLNGNIISFSPDGTVKRVQDGEVIESKGLNMLYDMEGTSSNSLDVTYNYNHAEARWTGSNNNTFLYSTSKYNYKDKHKYYISYNAKPDGPVRLRMYVNERYLDGDILNPILHEYNFRSGVLEAESQYGNHFNVRLFFDSDSVIGTKIDIKDLMMIDLTESFGEGNEPTKKQMDEIIQRFGFIPNAQDLIDRIEYKGNDLGDMENIIDGLYKTGVLSGTEVYTDKADDSVAHVEIDGNSYQHAGSGKNLLEENWDVSWDDSNVSSTYTYLLRPDITSIQDKVKVGDTLTFSFDVWAESDFALRVYDSNGNPGMSFGRHDISVKAGSQRVSFTETLVASGSSAELWCFDLYNNNNGVKFSVKNIQIEFGTQATPYEPPAPNPEYPAEIHSLNDFDVVSSVGKENLIGGSNTIKGGWIISTGALLVQANLPRVASDFIEVVPGSDMVFTYDGFYYTTSSTQKVMGVYDKDKIFIERLTSSTTNKVWKIKLNSQAKFVRIAYGASSSEYDNYAKLEAGSESTPWNYSHKDLENNLNNNFIDKINLLLDEPLRSVGDAKDRLFRDSDGIWKVERNVGNVIFNENTSLRRSVNGLGNVLYWVAASDKIYGSEYISTHYKWIDKRWNNIAEINVMPENTASYNPLIGVLVGSTEFPTVPAYQEWLKNNNVSFFYQLLNPSIETLPSDIQDKLNNLRSFEDSNYIYTVLPDRNNILSENLKPTLHAKFLYNDWYKKNRVINNLMIYNRALNNEEMLQNYKTIKRRWGM